MALNFLCMQKNKVLPCLRSSKKGPDSRNFSRIGPFFDDLSVVDALFIFAEIGVLDDYYEHLAHLFTAIQKLRVSRNEYNFGTKYLFVERFM